MGGTVEFGVRQGGGAGVDGDRVRGGPEPLHESAHERGRSGAGCRYLHRSGDRREAGPGLHESGQLGVEVAVQTCHRRRGEQSGGEVPREAQDRLVLPAQQAQTGGGGGGAGRRRPHAHRTAPVEGRGEAREAEARRAHRPGACPGRVRRQQPRQVKSGEARVPLALQPDPGQPLGQGLDRFVRVRRAQQGEGVGQRSHQPVQACHTVVPPGAGDVDRDLPLPAPPGQTTHVHGEQQMEEAHSVSGGPPLQRGGRHRAEGALVRVHRRRGQGGRITVVRQAKRFAPGGEPPGPVQPVGGESSRTVRGGARFGGGDRVPREVGGERGQCRCLPFGE
ncbi:hypothetical protein SGRI78S_02943 [Streptomyces griseus subsp. griseus]